MATKYKINRNKPLPTDEQINRHKNFSKLMSEHQKILKYKDATKPLYKNPKFFGLIMLLGIVMLVIFLPEGKEDHLQEGKNNSAADSIGVLKKDSLPSILKNSEGEEFTVPERSGNNSSDMIRRKENAKKVLSIDLPNVPFSTFEIDAEKGGEIYKGNARILIPPLAFEDKKGNKVRGKINIVYREFKDSIDIFLSGIPMHYDSSSKNTQLISAGMFEIKGFYRKEEIFISTPLKVEYAGLNHSTYNFYYFDENKKEWQFKGKDKESIRFMVQFDEKDFPELVPFKNVI
jgi:phage pi2 protein 07